MRLRGRIATVTIVVGLVAACAASPGFAVDYHVAPSGNDENPGTEASPLRTVQKACDSARAGDQIVLREGVYAESYVTLGHSGEEGKPIVLKNYSGERAIVEGRILLQALDGWQKPIGWITVEGLEIRKGWDGVKFYNAHDIVLRGNNIHDNSNQGILGNGHKVRIEGNTIARNGLRGDTVGSNKEHGIYCIGTRLTIVNNVIYGNRAYGIQVAGYDYESDKHAGPEFAGARHWLISHNTIAFNQNRGAIVVWQGDATDCIIQNNILYMNAADHGEGANQGIDFISGGGHVVRHNLFFAPGKTAIAGDGDVYSASNNLEEDPQFVDPDRFDFHLQPGSPAIDGGTSEAAIEADFEGTKRPQSRGYDIGAYEVKE
jgi:hypothetical protein